MPNKKNFGLIAKTAAIVTLVVACQGDQDSTKNENASIPESDTIELVANNASSPETITELEIEPPPLTIFFEFGQRDLSEENAEQIRDIADYLIETGTTFEVRGCTDRSGTEDDNFWLSYSRANTVLNALEAYNVPITRYMPEWDDQGNPVHGQDRDVYGEGEKCPSLVEGKGDTQEEARRVDILPNPEY